MPDTPPPIHQPSSGQLLRATVLAVIVASALLVAIVLPAEYGLDPTGIGRATGLFRPAASVDAAEDPSTEADGEAVPRCRRHFGLTAEEPHALSERRDEPDVAVR